MKYQNNGSRRHSLGHSGEVVRRYRASGLGLRRFAREHGIPPGRLHYWVYQKARAAVPARGRSPGVVPRFQEVNVAAWLGSPTRWAAEVSVAAGRTVRFSEQASAAWIGAVVHALHRTC